MFLSGCKRVYMAATLWTSCWTIESLQKTLYGSRKKLVYQTPSSPHITPTDLNTIERKIFSMTVPFPTQHKNLLHKFLEQPSLETLANIHCLLCSVRVDVNFFPQEFGNICYVVETVFQKDCMERLMKRFQKDPRHRNRKANIYMRHAVLSDAFDSSSIVPDFLLVFPFAFSLKFYETWCQKKLHGYIHCISYAFLDDWLQFEHVEDALQWGKQKVNQLLEV
jgi:hypothetical protein